MSLFDWGSTDRKLDLIAQWQQEIADDITGLKGQQRLRFDQLDKKLDELIGRVKDVQQKEKIEMAKVQDVIAKINEMSDVEDGVIALCTQLHQMLSDAKTDPAKLDEAITMLDQQKQKIADAIVANTDAA